MPSSSNEKMNPLDFFMAQAAMQYVAVTLSIAQQIPIEAIEAELRVLAAIDANPKATPAMRDGAEGMRRVFTMLLAFRVEMERIAPELKELMEATQKERKDA